MTTPRIQPGTEATEVLTDLQNRRTGDSACPIHLRGADPPPGQRQQALVSRLPIAAGMNDQGNGPGHNGRYDPARREVSRRTCRRPIAEWEIAHLERLAAGLRTARTALVSLNATSPTGQG